MKLEVILTEIAEVVNKKKKLFYIFILLLTATLFYMIGWIFCSLENRNPIEIEDFSEKVISE